MAFTQADPCMVEDTIMRESYLHSTTKKKCTWVARSDAEMAIF